MNRHETLPDDFAPWRTLGLGVSLVSFIVLAVGFAIAPESTWRVYLTGCLYCLGISLGSLGFVMMHRLTGGQWGSLTDRFCEAAAMNIPLMALFFLPIALFPHALYPWARPETWPAHDYPLAMRTAHYLTHTFFFIRYVIYFAIWSFWAWVIRRTDLAYDRSENPRTFKFLARFSAPGILLYIITMTLAGVDWIMSLDAHWYSTIAGFIIVVGQAMTGLAFCLVVLYPLRNRPPFIRALTPERLNDLGNLALTLVILFAYLSFSQFLICWMGNVENDARFYAPRMHGIAGIVGGLLITFHFFVPFLALLAKPIKRNFALLAGIGWFLLALRLVDLFWWILPMGAEDDFAPRFHARDFWLIPFGPLAVGGIWFFFFVVHLRGKPLMPLPVPASDEVDLHGNADATGLA